MFARSDVIVILVPGSIFSKVMAFIALPGILVGTFAGFAMTGWLSVMAFALLSISLNAVLYYFFFRLTVRAWKELWEP